MNKSLSLDAFTFTFTSRDNCRRLPVLSLLPNKSTSDMFQVDVSRFSPFSGSSKKGALPNTFDLLSRSFDDALLRRLQPLNHPPPSLTFSWFSLALDFLTIAHAQVRTLISNLKPPPASDDSPTCFFDESLKVLDVCNSIFSEIERLRQRRLVINFVMHSLDSSSEWPALEKLRKARDSLADWEANSPRGFTKRRFGNDIEVLIHDLARGLGSAPPRGKVSSVERLIQRAVYAVRAMTVFIAGSLAFALYGQRDAVTVVEIPAEFAWAESFNELQRTISEKMMKKGSQIEEMKGVETRVGRVVEVIDDEEEKDKRERLKDAVKELGTATTTFSEGLDGLYNGVNGMFQTVLGARNEMLHSYRAEGNEGKHQKAAAARENVM